jgi:hypothetical protein
MNVVCTGADGVTRTDGDGDSDTGARAIDGVVGAVRTD